MMIILIKLLILAVVGALIGWLTNMIAIKLIFRPIHPVTIPFLNIDIHGLIPKRKDEIAKSIGAVVEEELLSINEILEKIIEGEDISKIKNRLKVKINEIVEDKLPSIIPSAIKKMISNYIDDLVDTEGEQILGQLSQEVIDKATANIRISELVEEKINSYEMEKIENIIISIAKKELKHIEILGGLLGFFIGLLQGIIVNIF